MCGIAGVIDFQQAHGADGLRALAAMMNDRAAHRGPDGSNVFVAAPLALAHRRLAIIDLTSHGAQPMAYDDGRFVITYNGEIYNYIELQEELRALGHRFSSSSDTEVILAAYKQWGKACVGKFNGMWALALWDSQERTLFLSRDRFGVKPLYYIQNERYFAFASEIAQLLPLLPKVVVDEASAFDYLTFNLLDHTSRTFVAGVHRFAQSHSAIFSMEARTLQLEPFYQLAANEDYRQMDAAQAAGQFTQLLESSLKFRLRSDVPVGISLSGGLDSSWIGALAHRLGASGLTGFTAINTMERYDETPYVDAFLQRYPLPSKRVVATDDDFLSLAEQGIRAQGEPMVTTGPLAQYQVMQAVAQEKVKVLLSGQGADETFLGYHKYIPFYLISLLHQGRARDMVEEMKLGLRNTANLSPAQIVKYMLASGFSPLRSGMHRLFAPFVKDVFSMPRPAALGELSQAQREGSFAMQRQELFSSPLPLLLRYEDRNSMHFGIESRLPFMDYRLVEFALSLPWEMKVRGGWTKWIMREAARETLPEPIVWRKYKVAYHTPEDRWLSLHDEAVRARVLGNHVVAALCHLPMLKAMWPRLGVRMRWRLYALAAWSEIFDIRA